RGELRSRRARQGIGRHPQLGGEEAAQMPGRDPEAPPQLGLGPPVERAVEDQLNGPADQLRARPGDALRPPIGPAAKAGPVTRGLCRRGQGELPDILRARPRRTPWSTVDARRDDRREGFHNVTYTGPPASRPVTSGQPRELSGSGENTRPDSRVPSWLSGAGPPSRERS